MMNNNMGDPFGMGHNATNSMGADNMQGMVDPNAMSGMVNHGLTGSQTTQTTGLDNFDLTSILSGTLSFAVELFVILFIIGLIVALVVFLKRYLIDGNLNVTKPKTYCTKCGYTLNGNWNCCPKCGEARFNPQPTTLTSTNTTV